VSDLRAEVARLRASKGAAESGGIALDVESRLFELAVDIVHAFERVIFEEPSTSTSADAQAVG